MSDKNYYHRYRFYKERFRNQASEMQKMQTIIESCRAVLDQCTTANPQPFPSLIRSSPKTPPQSTLDFSVSAVASADESFGEPGANKWECVTDEERRQLRAYENQSSHDPDMTFYDTDGEEKSHHEKKMKVGELSEDEVVLSPPKVIAHIDSRKSTTSNGASNEVTLNKNIHFNQQSAMALESENQQVTVNRNIHFNQQCDMALESEKQQVTSELTPQKKTKGFRKLSPLKHICKQPRCLEHQPFYVSSKRELDKLSPRTKKLATTRRGKSPPGYWGLDMPSTQFIRSRNQENHDGQEENSEI